MRMQVAVARVVETGLPIIYVNQVGGQDELVFDGGSFGLNADRTLAFQMPQFETGDRPDTWSAAQRRLALPRRAMRDLPVEEANWRACVLGLRDYVDKNGFPGVVLGLSGGIDSAVCAAMAVDALGPERVHCVMLPYRYTSNGEPDRRRRLREAARRPLRHRAHRGAGRGLRRALDPLFANRRATSPRRTSSRARAARR